MVLSELGRLVLEEEIRKINHFYPMVEVWRIVIIPDHIRHLNDLAKEICEATEMRIMDFDRLKLTLSLFL